jgi:hypothetical protein
MPRSNFDDKVFLTSKGPFRATGPIPAGETLKWIWVWVFQNRPNKQAAARGYGGSFTGSNWQVTLQMAPSSDPFTKGRPAQGTALALVDDGGGKEEVYWWSEALRVLE